MRLRQTILLTSALTGFAASAQAQQTPAAPPTTTAPSETTAQAGPDAAGEEIVVTGYASSLRQALEIKRNANAVVDAISSEDIGKFPDRNVAESLSHIPGVSIDRRFGEGEKVAILGTDPALNRMADALRDRIELLYRWCAALGYAVDYFRCEQRIESTHHQRPLQHSPEHSLCV